jgi:hypothetical protein
VPGRVRFRSRRTLLPIDPVARLMLTRTNDFITLGRQFPRLMKKTAEARAKEIKKLLLAV